MYKKISMILLLVSFLFLVDEVRAYTCAYDVTFAGKNEAGEVTVDFEVDSTNNDVISTGLIEANVFLDSYIDSQWTREKVISEYLNSTCPNQVYVCHFSHRSCSRKGHCTTTSKYYYLFNGTLKGTLDRMDKDSIIPSSSDRFKDTYKSCEPGYFNENKSTAPDSKIDFPCDILDGYITEMNENDCKLGEEGCTSDKIEKYKLAQENAKNYCNVTLKYGHYGINPCVQSCIDFIKKSTVDFSDGVCGFSERLIHWIANIIRWVKYIIPVAVIVLGILDFIKAMSADKEDEMKKAQQRFIRRLIAAALIFIAPFIIEFILGKLGFNANGCGIINL